jgi:hypothetical protein
VTPTAGIKIWSYGHKQKSKQLLQQDGNQKDYAKKFEEIVTGRLIKGSASIGSKAAPASYTLNLLL